MFVLVPLAISEAMFETGSDCFLVLMSRFFLPGCFSWVIWKHLNTSGSLYLRQSSSLCPGNQIAWLCHHSLWWKQTSKAEQTGMVDLVVTLSPQFPLQHLPSLHLLPSSFSRWTMSVSSCYPRVKTFHAWGIIPRPKEDWQRNSLSSPNFYPWPSNHVHFVQRKSSSCHRHYSLCCAWFPHYWTEFFSTTPHQSFALVPWNRKSLRPPWVSWWVSFRSSLWST